MAHTMTHTILDIKHPFGYDSRYTVFIKDEGNKESIDTLKKMFQDDFGNDNINKELSEKFGIPPVDVYVKVSKSSIEEFLERKNNFKYSGKYDREDVVLIDHPITISEKREDYSSNEEWTCAVFETDFVKHLEWDEIFDAEVVS